MREVRPGNHRSDTRRSSLTKSLSLMLLLGLSLNCLADRDTSADFIELSPAEQTHILRQSDDDLDVDRNQYRTPLKLVSANSAPQFSDDYDFVGLDLAIERQLKRFTRKRLEGTIRMGNKTYPLAKAKESLEQFREMVRSFLNCKSSRPKAVCYQDFNLELKNRFDVYMPDLKKGDPRFGQEKTTFYTGYHTHPIEGRVESDDEFAHAVFANPKNTNLNKSRVQIDFEGALQGRGLEQVFTNFLFDVYLLHVAGSGKVFLTEKDGSKSEFYLHYDGTNRQRWEFIGPYMARKGYIVNGSIPSQRRFLRNNPNKQREIFSVCPSYVYLRASTEPPRGSDNIPVTDGRTIATDLRYYRFKGLLAFVDTLRPIEDGNYDLELEDRKQVQFQSFQRFFLDQDTGGAIEGKARVDIYFGSSTYAYYSAMNMEQTGRLFFLMLK